MFAARPAYRLPVIMPNEVPGADDMFTLLLDSGLGKHLRTWFGPPDEKVQGKYRRAEIFCFDAHAGDVIIAVCEPGDLGSTWYWSPHASAAPPWNAHSGFSKSPPVWFSMLTDLAHYFHSIGAQVDPVAMKAHFQEQGWLPAPPALRP